jgi:hypothetical protein
MNAQIMPASIVRDYFGADLKPCPFCGSHAVGLWAGPTPHATCMGCEADGPTAPRGGTLEVRQAHAINLWNTRQKEK